MCFSETKLSCPDETTRKKLEELVKGFKYRYYSTCVSKKGYSGTSIWCKKTNNIYYGFNAIKSLQKINNCIIEGRLITCELKRYYLIHVYTPNWTTGIKKIKYRVTKWDVIFRKYIKLYKRKASYCMWRFELL